METEFRFANGEVVQLDSAGGDLGVDWQWFPQGPGVYDVRMGNRNVRAELIDGPDAQGHVHVRINGVEMRIQVANHRSLLLEKMGMNVAEDAGLNRVEAPMPGKVLSVSVKTGDEVQEGDALLVLEAMKMENVIRAPQTGILSEVLPVAGQAVEKGALLVAYEIES